MLFGAGEIQLCRSHERLDALGIAFHDDEVTGNDPFARGKAPQASAMPDQADDVDVLLVGHRKEIANCRSALLCFLADLQFRYIETVGLCIRFR